MKIILVKKKQYRLTAKGALFESQTDSFME